MASSDSDFDHLDTDHDIHSVASEQEDSISENGKRKRGDDDVDGVREIWLGARVRCDMFPLPLDHPAWSKLSHVFLEDGIYYDEALMECHVKGNFTMPFWKELTEKHPHIKVVWCLPNVMMLGESLDRAMSTNQFWFQLENVMNIVKADYLELNLESVPMKHGMIADGWSDKLIVILPNSLDRLQFGWEWGMVEKVLGLVCKAVMNSFGFLQKDRVHTQHGYVDLVKTLPECGLTPFHEVMTPLDKHASKIMMGIDTQAVRYLLDQNNSEHFYKFELLTRHQLLIEKEKGYRPPEDLEKRQYKYKSVYYPELQGSLLELRRKKVMVSYDSVSDIHRKVDYMVNSGMGGFVIGCLDHDVAIEDKQSILMLVDQRLRKQSE